METFKSDRCVPIKIFSQTRKSHYKLPFLLLRNLIFYLSRVQTALICIFILFDANKNISVLEMFIKEVGTFRE